MIELRADVASALAGGGDPFAVLMALEGEVYRQHGGRCTRRVEIGGRHFFLKTHQGVGWWEIIRNLLQLRAPVLGARPEWRAIQRLHGLQIDTMQLAGYGMRGHNPAWLQSFVLTDELTDVVSLEDYCRGWGADTHPPRSRVRIKRALVTKIAEIAATLHRNGLNHRDFYLCHLLLDLSAGDPQARGAEPPRLYLIDLHRVQQRRQLPWRWRVKDVGSLWFSAMAAGLTQRDRLRFMQCYSGGSLRSILQQQSDFWSAVERRGQSLAEKWARLGYGTLR